MDAPSPSSSATLCDGNIGHKSLLPVKMAIMWLDTKYGIKSSLTGSIAMSYYNVPYDRDVSFPLHSLFALPISPIPLIL